MTPLGERAFVLRDLDEPAWRLARRIEAARLRGVDEVCAAYETVAIYVEPSEFDERSLADLPDGADVDPSRRHTVPTWYAIDDDVLCRTGLTADDVVAAHTSVDYECAAIGFCPGFPYLRSLPDVIAGIPRAATPRVRTEPGSVAITGRQTGIYPLPRPGGWAVIGRTPLTIVDEADDYFPIRAGDTVRFVAIDGDEFHRLQGERL